MNARFIFAALLLAGCDGGGGEPAPAAAVEKAKGATGAVEVVPVVSQRLETTTRLPAEIYAYESVALYPRVNGFVEDVLVDRGSAVRKGQLLARLSAPELTAQRAEAESKLAAARSTFERTCIRARWSVRRPGAMRRRCCAWSRSATCA
jgi:membrane fusion protein (multidrug efflux system)